MVSLRPHLRGVPMNCAECGKTIRPDEAIRGRCPDCAVRHNELMSEIYGLQTADALADAFLGGRK